MADILHLLRLCAMAPSCFHSNFTECAKDFQADGTDLSMFEVKSCVKMSRGRMRASNRNRPCVTNRHKEDSTGSVIISKRI